MFSPVFAFHWSGRFCPSAMPDACGPRNDGQLPLLVSGFARGRAFAVCVNFRGARAADSPAGNQLLRSRIICRGLQSSETKSNEMRLPSTLTRYLPGLDRKSVV